MAYQTSRRRILLAGVCGALLAAGPCVRAQQPPGHDSPRPEELEPGVNTSAPVSPAAPAEPARVAAPSGTTAVQPASQPGDSPPTGHAAVPSAHERASAGVKEAKDTKDARKAPDSNAAAARAGKAEDHLQLDTTQITGNQELPKVLYIVPWKRSDLGDLLGRPANSLLDEVLEPVDRDVFKRENRYYDALKPDAAAGSGQGGGPAAGAAVQGSGDKR